MKGRRVLVTGAGTGIGKGIALAFARAGATVALQYAHSASGAEEAVAEIRRANGTAAAFPADFRSRDDVRELARKALSFLGGIDVLVNNAGITMTLPFEEVTDEQFDTLYAVNVGAPFFLTQALLPGLRSSPGAAIINLTSIQALQGFPEHSVYAGTRGAIVSFTRELAIELAPLGIRVNAIAPGSTNVENHRVLDPTTDLAARGRKIPVGFVGEPADIAAVAVFLASDAARYIVGQTLVVDGGTTSWLPFGEQFRLRREPSRRNGKGYVPGI